MTASPFIGSCCAAHQAGAFAFGRWVAGGSGHVAAHGHAEAHIMYVPLGDYVTEARGERPADNSYLVYNPGGIYHRDRMTGPGMFFSVTISDSCLGDDPLPSAPSLIANPMAHAALRALVRETGNWDGSSSLRAESLCLELLGAISARPARERSRPSWLDAAIELFDAGRDFSVATIAGMIGVHPVHLARTFRAFHGCTPGDYARTRRCRRAAHLLSRTRMPVADVALAAGFADQSHMTKQFGRTIGVPPGEFRRITSH